MTSALDLGKVFGFDVVKEIHPRIKICRIPTENGLPLEQAFMVLTPADGALGLPAGDKGDKGDQGEPAPAWKLEPDILPGRSSLPDWLTNAPVDRGKAWFVKDGDDYELAYWTGTTWNYYPSIVIPGPKGDPPVIDGVTVEMLDAEAEPVGSVTGEDGSYAIHVGIPVEPGPPGPQGSTIINASSFTTTPDEGSLLGWDADAQKLKPIIPTIPIGPITIPPSGFTGAAIPSNQSNTRVTVATLQLPSLPFYYFIDTTGWVEISSGSSTRIDVEVRLGGDTTAQKLVAYGGGVRGNNWQAVRFSTAFDDPLDPLSSQSGYSGVMIPPNTSGPSTTIHVVAAKIEGPNQSWQVRPDRAQLVVRIIPAPIHLWET
ncbi:hypothetical protein [Hoyosella altamirensis]|uniref:Minor tail protein n=1 Tax=Hoyosella altamirensis TaxID=616997 RepID=A0A839RQP6_9ACTN|nr:hypothetical protein [Hoyosella altamirensis]MBB3038416.1 hypothetical protein [Hoyosella altamirensis]